MATVPASVEDLVARYKRESETLQSSSYGEADTRKEFVEPLFGALGWDVYNSAHSSEAYKDVVNEYSLRVGATHKAPDYAFRVGGSRTFFVEAKRPGVDITRDPSPAYQLRRYGWTAKLPISVLVNFRHIAIYDCTVAPKELDKPSVGRTILVSWQNIVERWDEIFSLIGKVAVYQGSLERYGLASGRRRGTTLVDDEFLKQMEQWRSVLAVNIAQQNTSLTVADLNEAVQQTIDRLVFLRIAEDRGIEPYGSLKAVVDGAGVYARLLDCFRAADTRYNSGLFHFKLEASVSGSPDTLTPNLRIDDRVLRGVIGEMYYPASPYEFSVLPADILGQVYEQFLGKVISLKGRKASVEEKPEVKKAGGVYYTPTNIVEYIVQRTLGEALRGASLDRALKLRILDPSCGSGSFLIGAYDYLLTWFTEKYSRSSPAVRRNKVFRNQAGEWKLSLSERKRILTSCIFGVDIDGQAVEVTKLSLMLKVLEDQSAETINQQMQIFHVERVLPDLDRNIQCGNSLVGSDALTQIVLDSSEEHLLNAFDWGLAFPSVMNEGGFSVVIGNPPYDVLEKDRGGASWPHATLREYLPLRPDYSPALGGKLNLYRLFIVQAVSLTRPRGFFGMIVPLGLAADISTAMTRGFVLASLDSLMLDCFPQKDNPSRRVFRRAKLSTLVISGRRAKATLPSSSVVKTRIFPGNELTDRAIENSLTVSDCSLLDDATIPIPLTNSAEWNLCKKIYSITDVVRLKDLGNSYDVTRGEINQTTFGAFISGSPSGSVPLLKGVEVGAFVQNTHLSQGVREWLDERSLLHLHPNKSKPAGQRIAIQRITGVDERQRLIAALIVGEPWFAQRTRSLLL